MKKTRTRRRRGHAPTLSPPRTLSRLAAALSARAWVPEEWTAGEEMSRSRSVAAHLGQAGVEPLRTSASNSCPHALQVYSKIGMA